MFRLITTNPEQDSTESSGEVAVLNLRGKGRQVYLFCYCWSFSCQCFSRVETSQSICVMDQLISSYVGLRLAWRRLKLYPYYLVIMNMLFFNARFVTFLLRTILENDQVLAYVLKTIKM